MKKKNKNRQEQRLVNKRKLIEKREELYKNILKRTNQSIYKNFLDLKDIVEINKDLEGREGFDKIAERLGCNVSYIKYLLRFKKLKDLSWLDKVPANVILLTINFNDDAEKRQEEHFKHFEEHQYNVNKARVYLVKEYVEKQGWDKDDFSHILYRKLSQMIHNLTNTLNLVKRSTMNKKEKDMLKLELEDINSKAKTIFDEK